jgi:DNA mismatch endonuclease (patch repair protein)
VADVVNPAVRSRMMSGIRGKDTRPEKLVRSALFAAGFRFRLHSRNLPGKPDLVLARWRTVVFINGCFWHAHPDCRFFRVPKNRRSFWIEKLGANRSRDIKCTAAIASQGWKVVTVWECALRADAVVTLDLLQHAIRNCSTLEKWDIRENRDPLGKIELIKAA